MARRPAITRTRLPLLAFLGGSFAVGVFGAFNNFTLSLWLTGFTSSYLVISLLGNSKSFEGAIVSPVAGAWSDRIWIPGLGRRRPFILVGGLLAAALLALTPAISRLELPLWLAWLPDNVRVLAPAAAAIFLFTLAFNAMDDIHKALLVDITEPSQRNRISAWSTVVTMAGNVLILAIGFVLWKDSVPDAAFAIAGLLVAGGVLVTVVGVRERPSAQAHPQAPNAKPPVGPRAAIVELFTRYRGALVFCGVAFAYWTGVNAVLPLVSVYTRDILGATVGQAQLLPALLLVSTTLLAIPIAKLGDRLGRRRVLATGYAVMAIAAVAGLVITTVPEGAVVFLLAGVGNAAATVLAVPLMADLVPRERMGVATGVLAASGSLAAPLASLVAGGLSDIYGPRAIFALMTVMVIAALVLLPFVRRPTVAAARSPSDAARRVRSAG